MRLSRLAEQDLIAAIRQDFGKGGRGLVLGIGDDAAVIRPGKQNLILTTDLLIEGSHFLRSLHPPFELGRKSLAVNISDIAAMGGRPLYALLGLGLPPATPGSWVDRFFAGMKSAAREFGVRLIGGDLSRSRMVVISVTLIGEGKSFVRRSGGRPGHLLFVSGFPGQSHAGLELLKKGFKRGGDRSADRLIKAFLDPIPQVELGLELARRNAASAMLDTSDGLSVDVGNLCRESGVGAEIAAENIPISPELKRLRKSPMQDALYGGEDYGLLFAVPQARVPEVKKLRKRFHLAQIGRLTAGRKIYLIHSSGQKTLFKPRGFRHFK
jgi:thiamine-monophosphate kinase